MLLIFIYFQNIEGRLCSNQHSSSRSSSLTAPRATPECSKIQPRTAALACPPANFGLRALPRTDPPPHPRCPLANRARARQSTKQRQRGPSFVPTGARRLFGLTGARGTRRWARRVGGVGTSGCPIVLLDGNSGLMLVLGLHEGPGGLCHSFRVLERFYVPCPRLTSCDLARPSGF